MLKKLIALVCVLMLASPVYAASERFTLDKSHTTVAFLVDHVGFAKP